MNGLAVMIVGPFLARSVRTPRCRRVATGGAGFARPDRAGPSAGAPTASTAVAALQAAYAVEGWGIRPNCISSETWS
jgi:hypothetical protein